MCPDGPSVVVPELKVSFPLTPAVPALDVFTTNCPLVDVVPRPLVREIAPPVPYPNAAVLSPARTVKSPPVSWFTLAASSPVPGEMESTMSPPLPKVAAPDEKTIDPDDPKLVVPDVKVNEPLTPLVPAFIVLKTILPLDCVVLYPADNEMLPPVPPSSAVE
jgi:hypothetical protein